MPATQVDVWATPAREIAPGFRARFIHSERTTHAYWEIDPGILMPEHSHHHEQTVNVLEGSIEFVVEGRSHMLEAGHVLVIPSHVPHSAEALAPCKMLVVFSPVREEYL
ncbi:MAG: cupin domain-containing protein [Gemmatimonadetes bacterium]|jgi:quercetin dioxygenase-like cupin family protein|nr:cupin domain-containing protein [Gemmatimonadota bacterium]